MMTVLRYLVALSVCLILLSITAIAQEDDVYTDESFYGLPDVAINSHAVSLQASLYPEYYRTHSARSDLRWVQRNDSALTAFWEENRTLILQFLSQNSGIPWVESEFDIYLIRYYHTAGEGNPVILPLGGIRTGDLIEAPPSGARLQFGLIFQMAKRMLAQS
ncbi:hypothetical protein GF420_03220, partial [candidate division GN15 bacterium]|nr:hypothetical protein [candidate division GN15 bacterium]